MTANPGMHVQSLRPIVRVVMVDALERWAVSLSNAAPLFTVESAYELADRIVNPRPPKESNEADTVPPVQESVEQSTQHEGEEFSRAGAIFRAADEAEAFDPADLGFAFEEGSNVEIPRDLIESNPAVPVPAQSSAKKRYLGMTVQQLALLAGMFLVEICVLIGFGLIIFLNP